MVVKSDLDAYDAMLDSIMSRTFVDGCLMDVHDLSIITLYSSMVEKARSIEILVGNRVLDSVEVIQRSMIEQSVYLKYILQKDTKRRGRAFFYGHKYKEIKDIEDTFNFHPNKAMTESIKQGIKEKYEKESQQKYPTFEDYQKSIIKKFDELFQERIKNRKYWFNIDGEANSIAKLFQLMDEADTYYGFYVPNSAHTHGSSVVTDTNLKKGKFEIQKTIDLKMKDVMIWKCLNYGINDISNYYGVKLEENEETAGKYKKILINYKYNNMNQFSWPV